MTWELPGLTADGAAGLPPQENANAKTIIGVHVEILWDSRCSDWAIAQH